jgi:hypothetical protein
MAKKPAPIKRSVVAKSVKSSGKNTKAPQKSYGKPTPKKTAKSNKRISYKEEYIKLLQRTNKTLTKEVKAIRKAIEQPREIPEAFPYEAPEAFPYEAPVQQIQHQQPISPGSIEEQILSTLREIEIEIRSRDMLLQDLVHGSAKLEGFE